MLDFVDKVYKLVSQIPKGKVMTYQQVARTIGRPNAARAVGNILNKNPHLLKIPCHRVVRSDGGVGGYIRGAKLKEKLLRGEEVKINKGKIDLVKYLLTR